MSRTHIFVSAHESHFEKAKTAQSCFRNFPERERNICFRNRRQRGCFSADVLRLLQPLSDLGGNPQTERRRRSVQTSVRIPSWALTTHINGKPLTKKSVAGCVLHYVQPKVRKIRSLGEEGCRGNLGMNFQGCCD